MDEDYILICFSFALVAIVIYFLGKVVLKLVDAFLDRYRAKTALIKAQAEQAKQQSVK